MFFSIDQLHFNETVLNQALLTGLEVALLVSVDRAVGSAVGAVDRAVGSAVVDILPQGAELLCWTSY